MNTTLYRTLLRLGARLLAGAGKPHRMKLVKRNCRVGDPLPDDSPRQLARTPFNRTENRQ